MTREEFCESLRSTPRDWFVSRNGKIMRPGGNCPWLELEERGQYQAIVDNDPLNCDIIADVADGVAGCDQEFRAQLLEACGLQE